MKEKLTIEKLIEEAEKFCVSESKIKNKSLFGITDGKAVGTYIEHKFTKLLNSNYVTQIGSSAIGIDLTDVDIQTDIKVTSIKQPQSSCPFKDAKQKIYGLGYNLLVFVYEKIDDPKSKTAILDFVSCSFISKELTADYTTTYRLREMIKDGAILEDIVCFLNEKNIPADEITLNLLAKQILDSPPLQGYLTISNALQWRLQYQRIVNLDSEIVGIKKFIDKVVKI